MATLINPLDELITLCEQKNLDVGIGLIKRINAKTNRPAILRIIIYKGKDTLTFFDQDDSGHPSLYEMSDVAIDYLESNGVL